MSGRPGSLLVVVLLFVARFVGQGESLPAAARVLRSADLGDDTQEYLASFGYLPSSGANTGNQRSEKAVREALQGLQRFAGLNPTGVLDDATKRLMRTKRCGLPDRHRDALGRSKRYTVQGPKWGKTHLTYKLKSWTEDLGSGETRRIIYNSLRIWSDVSALSFTETLDDNADILVEFSRKDHGDGFPFDGPNIVLAHAFFPGEGIGGDVHFDDDEFWSQDTARSHDRISLFSVASHEFGHSLGFSHSNLNGSLMYPYYQSFPEGSTLPYEDAIGVQSMYGSGGKMLPSPTVPTTPGATLPASTTKTETAPTLPTAPRPCATSIDAVALIRREIFVFKGYHFWRFDENGKLVEEPVEIERFWYGLPKDFTHVDAVYERPGSDVIIFFAGRRFWEFSANQARPGFPKDISHLGLPAYVERIDAVFVWAWNGKTYFFAGDKYWAFDEATDHVELDYPRKVDVWGGVPYNVDAAFSTGDDTYFFKGEMVYKFDGRLMKVEKGFPVSLQSFWNHCGGQYLKPKVMEAHRLGPLTEFGSSGAGLGPFAWLPMILLAQILV